jgi:hypothetical protein
MRIVLLLYYLLTVNFGRESLAMEHELMWISMNEQLFEYVQLTSDRDLITADGWIIRIGDKPLSDPVQNKM